jgi:hypothetical protein
VTPALNSPIPCSFTQDASISLSVSSRIRGISGWVPHVCAVGSKLLHAIAIKIDTNKVMNCDTIDAVLHVVIMII